MCMFSGAFVGVCVCVDLLKRSKTCTLFFESRRNSFLAKTFAASVELSQRFSGSCTWWWNFVRFALSFLVGKVVASNPLHADAWCVVVLLKCMCVCVFVFVKVEEWAGVPAEKSFYGLWLLWLQCQKSTLQDRGTEGKYWRRWEQTFSRAIEDNVSSASNAGFRMSHPERVNFTVHQYQLNFSMQAKWLWLLSFSFFLFSSPTSPV